MCQYLHWQLILGSGAVGKLIGADSGSAHMLEHSKVAHFLTGTS